MTAERAKGVNTSCLTVLVWENTLAAMDQRLAMRASRTITVFRIVVDVGGDCRALLFIGVVGLGQPVPPAEQVAALVRLASGTAACSAGTLLAVSPDSPDTRADPYAPGDGAAHLV